MVKIKKHIPNMMTLFNIAAGIASIMLGLGGEYGKAAGLIIVSVIVDCFDGYVARMFNSTSKFGGYMDTISDFLAFGVSASILMLKVYSLNIVLAVIFTLASAFRLLYFMKTKNSKFFFGLPTTTAGGFIATIVILKPPLPFNASLLMIGLSLLMLSRIKYYRIDFSNKKTLTFILAVFLYLFVLDLNLAVWGVLTVFLAYILFGWLRIREVKG
jgi:CDP-diacylglycerol---serine O-phosphatidyltransferase